MAQLSTSQLRVEHAPACQASGSFAPAYAALDAAFKYHDYRPRAGVTGARNCRMITGGSNYSLHAYFGDDLFTFWTGVRIGTAVAVDVNWDKNPYGPQLVTDMPRAMIDDIYKIHTNSGVRVWRWGGYYSRNKDAMHFEIVCSLADLASGIDPATMPGAERDEHSDSSDKEIEDDMAVAIIKGQDSAAWWLWDLGENDKRHIRSQKEALTLAFAGAKCVAIKNLRVQPWVFEQSFVDAIPRRSNTVNRSNDNSIRTNRILHRLMDNVIKPAGSWAGLLTAFTNMKSAKGSEIDAEALGAEVAKAIAPTIAESLSGLEIDDGISREDIEEVVRSIFMDAATDDQA